MVGKFFYLVELEHDTRSRGFVGVRRMQRGDGIVTAGRKKASEENGSWQEEALDLEISCQLVPRESSALCGQSSFFYDPP